jgi:hypothetical protein
MMTLKARIARLEVERTRGVIEIVRERPDGGAAVTVVRDGRIVGRWDATPGEAAKLARGAITIERSYGGAR